MTNADQSDYLAQLGYAFICLRCRFCFRQTKDQAAHCPRCQHYGVRPDYRFRQHLNPTLADS